MYRRICIPRRIKKMIEQSSHKINEWDSSRQGKIKPKNAEIRYLPSYNCLFSYFQFTLSLPCSVPSTMTLRMTTVNEFNPLSNQWLSLLVDSEMPASMSSVASACVYRYSSHGPLAPVRFLILLENKGCYKTISVRLSLSLILFTSSSNHQRTSDSNLNRFD